MSIDLYMFVHLPNIKINTSHFAIKINLLMYVSSYTKYKIDLLGVKIDTLNL